jgi:hypothetical protein
MVAHSRAAMKTNSFLSRLIKQLPDSDTSVEARRIADAVSYHPNLCQWLITSVIHAGRQAAPMLSRSAQFMRDEVGDFAVGAHLDRLASEPALIRAVVRELNAAGTSSRLQTQPMSAL